MPQILRHLPEVCRARIFRVIDAMTESRNFLLLRQHAFDVLHRIGSVAVDRHQDMEYRFIGAAMQRTLQRPNG